MCKCYIISEIKAAVLSNIEIYKKIIASLNNLDISAGNNLFQGIPTNLVKILLEEERENSGLIV